MHGGGVVVREERQVDGVAEAAEVAGDLRGVRAGEEGRGGDERVRAEAGRGAGLVDDAGGGHVDDPGQHGHPAVDRRDDGGEHGAALRVAQIGGLPAGAEGEDGVHSGRDGPLGQGGEGRGVDVAGRGEGGAERRDDAGEGCGQAHRVIQLSGGIRGRWIRRDGDKRDGCGMDREGIRGRWNSEEVCMSSAIPQF